MKRYLLFVFESYYPRGGWDDFAGSFDVLSFAIESGGRKSGNQTLANFHVVDSETGSVVHDAPYKPKPFDMKGFQVGIGPETTINVHTTIAP